MSAKVWAMRSILVLLLLLALAAILVWTMVTAQPTACPSSPLEAIRCATPR